MKIYDNLFAKIISPENLFAAWDAFKCDKRNKRDVMAFERHLEENIFSLRDELRNGTYEHGPYAGFYIQDPKQRHIHKATVRDRVLHHAVFAVLNQIFEPTFIADSFSCRVGKGTHKGVNKLAAIAAKVSRNNFEPCYALKCDIEKFFASIDHQVLKNLIARRVKDARVLELCRVIIESFPALFRREREREKTGPADREFDFPAFRQYLFERT